MRHLKKSKSIDSINVIDLPLPFKVQAPTFATVSEAYAYFTRHQDNYAVPDYSDDSDDDLPQFLTSDDVDDLFDGPLVAHTPHEVGPPSSPENEDGVEERSEETTDEAEG